MERDVPGEHDSVVGQVDDDVSARVRSPEVADVRRASGEVHRQAAVERHVGRRRGELADLGPRGGIELAQERAVAVPLGQQVVPARVVSDDRGSWQDSVPEDVVAVPMRVDDVQQRCARHCAHLVQERVGECRRHQRVDYDDAVLARDEPGVRGAVRLDERVDPARDFDGARWVALRAHAPSSIWRNCGATWSASMATVRWTSLSVRA